MFEVEKVNAVALLKTGPLLTFQFRGTKVKNSTGFKNT
jgi:hypothetical protein